ncbi:MAG: HAD family hydrolase [Actinophytocola sp.]|uniref:HAD family hydrolase n=1 Tax=Actinophytocola sp. TaxID=1872138 RepID=UPI003C72DA49
MTGYSAVALDVGGVIYYDEPFELAWLHGLHTLRSADDSSFTVGAFIEHAERFYRHGDATLLGSPSQLEWSWNQVRRAWGELAQPIPGALAAVAALAEHTPTVIVANQPPECAAVLAAWGVTEACSAVFLDSLAGVSKPDPALLELAVAHVGTAERLLVVGNRVDHDVRPALALGCPVAFVLADPGYRPPAGVHPDIVAAHRRFRAPRTAPPAPSERVRIVASLSELAESVVSTGTHL